ncbi:MAG: CDP-alcohol phosphatidyltransferase family protein [Nocardioides sp.]
MSLAALVLLLAILTSLGLAPTPAAVGFMCGVGLCVAVHRGLAAADSPALGPADVVTMGRAILACALVALVVDPAPGEPAAALIVPLAAVALALDAVDGRVARVTGTGSDFGGRFDGEADAFLLLVLSVHVSPSYGWWVLAIGAARYAFGLAGWVWPWLRVKLPFRYWRKVVTAAQGIALVVAAAGVLPRTATYAALVTALALLAESFGRDVLWSWRRHRTAPVRSVREAGLGLP